MRALPLPVLQIGLDVAVSALWVDTGRMLWAWREVVRKWGEAAPMYCGVNIG